VTELRLNKPAFPKWLKGTRVAGDRSIRILDEMQKRVEGRGEPFARHRVGRLISPTRQLGALKLEARGRCFGTDQQRALGVDCFRSCAQPLDGLLRVREEGANNLRARAKGDEQLITKRVNLVHCGHT